MSSDAGRGLVERAAEEAAILARGAARARADPGIAPRAPGEVPASPFQRRLAFLGRIEPADRSYRLATALRLGGDLDVLAMRSAFDDIVARHDALRMVVRLRAGVAWLEHVAADKVRLREVVLSARVGWDRHRLRRLAELEARRPFDLEDGPLARATLFRIRADEHLFVLTLHHAIADAWSVAILFEDLAACYAARVRGAIPRLDPLPITFGDYAAWIAEREVEGRLEPTLAFWREQLRGAPPMLDLGIDHARPRRRRHRGERASTMLGPIEAALIDGCARRLGVTPAVLMIATLAVLLHRRSGARDIVIGVPVANRMLAEQQRVIGPFVSTLPLRARIGESASFADVAKQLQGRLLEALAHQDVPLERLTSELALHGDLSHTPLFQVLCNVQSIAAPELALPGLAVESDIVRTGGAKLDLALQVRPASDGWEFELDYDRDLFRRATGAALLSQFTTLLTNGAVEPSTRCDELQAATEAGHSIARGEERPIPLARVVDLVGEAAARDPDAVAVRDGSSVMTYRDLMAAVDLWETRLGEARLVPEDIVAVLLPRSCEMVAVLLAIQRAGAAYLPLDPVWPPERMRTILADASPKALVATLGLCDALGPLPGAMSVITGRDPGPADATARRAPAARPIGELAYVIYTSGSTGMPKGVLVEHRGLTNHVVWAREHFGLDAGSGSVVGSSVAFDLVVPNLYAPLMAGKTVALAADADIPGGAAETARGGYSFIKVTPSHMRALQELISSEELDAIAGCVVLAGEELPLDVLDPWRERSPGQRMINEYGPTEVSVACTTYEFRAGAVAEERIPIGRPLWNASVYVVDRRLRPVPIGIIGEICVAGVGIARGYHRRPGLTAERFVPDPFSPSPGARMYRTGDLGRFRTDGELVFAGRADTQVKVRGVRVELGEIDAVMARHPDVQGAAAIARRIQGQLRLEAHVVPRPNFREDDLRAWLRRRLPEQMVPSRICLVDRIPLTGNGKVDRAALAAAEPPVASRAAPAEQPSTPTEEVLAKIWEETLAAAVVGRADDFFALGGDSLRALRVSAAIVEGFGLAVLPDFVFLHPLLSEMASAIDRQRAAESVGVAAARVRPDAGVRP